MAKRVKLLTVMPLFNNQEMLLTLGLIVNPQEHDKFLERPTWPAWKELMQRDIATQTERALSQGLMTLSELEEFAQHSCQGAS